MSKITLHVSVGEYEFVEVETEIIQDSDIAVSAAAKGTYDTIKAAFAPKAGVTDKEMNAFVDNMLMGGDNHIESWEKMSDTQRSHAQTIKRALARIAAKEQRHQ